MSKQACKKFGWVIKNFSSLQCEECNSVPVLIGDSKWFLSAFPRGDGDVDDYLSLYLEVADFESLPCGWRRLVKFRLTVVNQLFFSDRQQETHCWFDQNALGWGFEEMIPLTKLHDEKEAFLVNGDLVVVAEVEVLEVIGILDESEKDKETSNFLKKRKLEDEVVEESNDLLKEASSAKESMDVNGFQVLLSQVESVEFRAKNQNLRNACMNSLLSLVETLRQSLEELSNEDLVEADSALRYVKDAGFKVDWLEKKLEEVKEKKEKELSR